MTRTRSGANSAASVRARLLQLARIRRREFQLVLSEFAIERLLFRLGASPHRERFVLKGAMLFKLWSEDAGRATWDLDLLGRGASGVADVADVIRELCAIDAEDAIVFDSETIKAEEIRAFDEDAGVRVRLEARLGNARIPVQIDVGFGDAVVPPPTREHYPTLLNHQTPDILVYPREAVVAEKLEAMVSLGVTNSRMKDFYDVYVLAREFEFDGPRLIEAVRATFARRRTDVPQREPIALTREFLAAPERATQWRAFLRRGRLEAPVDAGALAEKLHAFLWPVLEALAPGGAPPTQWMPGGPWR